jgi:hypothetical protein
VDERTIVRDNSKESSVLESEPAESQKTAGSSDKDLDSEQPSESTQSVSPPAASPENRKRKRKNDEEDSGASKPAAPAAK